MELSVSNIAALYAKPHPKNNSVKIYPKIPGKNVAFALAHESSNKRTNAQKKIGLQREKEGIDMYEEHTGNKVNFRNSRMLTIHVGNTKVVGKVDGINDRDVVIEHKRRTRGLLRRVLLHERIQCILYMKMLGVEEAHLVETFGEHIIIHPIPFDESLWNDICFKINDISKISHR